MRELVRTNDMVLVSAIGALLDGANIHHLVLDQNMSSIEGSLGVLPRRGVLGGLCRVLRRSVRAELGSPSICSTRSADLNE